jgi:HAD superfamily hydrolase (TIGR01544 family)
MDSAASFLGLSALIVRILHARRAARVPTSEGLGRPSGEGRAPMRGAAVTSAAEELSRKTARILAASADDVHLVLDFDRTITTLFYDATGMRGASCHGIVEHEWAGEARAKAVALNEFYYPLEVTHELTHEQKIPYMVEWYESINRLIVAEGLTKGRLVKLVASAPCRLRPGVVELLDWAQSHGVPVTVFSAGITDVCVEVLRQKWKEPSEWACMRVVSNAMEWDADGQLVSFQTPLIHMFNKTAAVLEVQDPAHSALIRARPLCILVGDGLGDAEMMPRLENDTTLRVGLCNTNEDTLLPAYLAAFDTVVCGDGDLQVVLDITRRIRRRE